MLNNQRLYTLPNDLIVSHQNVTQIDKLYTEIFEDEVYLQHGITLNDGDCVFDVGANIGFFTLFVHKKCKKACVYAFEPIPSTFNILRTNLDLNNIEAHLFKCGLSDKIEEVKFTSFPRLNIWSSRFPDLEEARPLIKSFVIASLAPHRRNSISPSELDELVDKYFLKREMYTCSVVTLSHIIHSNNVERIDLLKIDAEKSEFDILTGIHKRDWKKIKQIVLEVHGRKLLDQVVPLLKGQGYSIVVKNEKFVDAGVQEVTPKYLYIVYAIQHILST